MQFASKTLGFFSFWSLSLSLVSKYHIQFMRANYVASIYVCFVQCWFQISIFQWNLYTFSFIFATKTIKTTLHFCWLHCEYGFSRLKMNAPMKIVWFSDNNWFFWIWRRENDNRFVKARGLLNSREKFVTD